MPKLSKACYAIRVVKSFMSKEKLRMIYLFYIHSIMTYGIIFGGNSSDSNIFRIQMKIIRAITNSRNRDSCLGLFKKLMFFHYNHNIYFPFYHLLFRIGIYINPNLRFMVLTPDMVLIYILPH
jgi:hypothetical protein